jgi:hypothetical protein
MALKYMFVICFWMEICQIFEDENLSREVFGRNGDS